MQLYRVTKVIDGDTFMIDPPIYLQKFGLTNRFTKVRLANINAEESGTPKGIQASLYLKELIEQRQVTLEPVGISYDRVVADVTLYPINLNVNVAMVYKGHTKRA